MDGWGHLTGEGGWGVLQHHQSLGHTFTATWRAKITHYNYSCFVLFADSPWNFDAQGETDNGYVVWLDINDPQFPKMDIMKKSRGQLLDLSGKTRDVSLTVDIPQNEWFTWKLEKEPEFIRIYINDELIIETSDTEFAKSDFKLGLSFGEDSQGFFDDLVITTNTLSGPKN